MKNELRFRQVHLDFHTSEEIPDIGANFDPDQFADTLVKANVDSINLFARGHHGWIYFDTKQFPERIHPHTRNRNLLKEQIEACHNRGIKTPVYVTVQWDQYTAEHHPEWLVITPDGKQEGTPPYEAGFYRSLCVNSPYVEEFLKPHCQEIAQTLPLDGWWFDIVLTKDCSCRYCRAQMIEQGIDPHDDARRVRFGIDSIHRFQKEMSDFVWQFDRDKLVFYNAGHIGVRHRDCFETYSHFELESLASGHWGFMHYPITMRYARTLGPQCLGMTGKFHTAWGDFHSFKSEPALSFECQRMLALNAKCCIGDQLHPSGRICPDTYELIGKVYGDIKDKEPWCVSAEPVTEIGVLHPEEFHARTFEEGLSPSLIGASRVLQEGSWQFDIIDSRQDLSKYKLVILPDEIPVDAVFGQKLEAYLSGGGKILCSFESGLDQSGRKFASEIFGVQRKSEGPLDLGGKSVCGEDYYANDYTDYIIPKGPIGAGLPETEHVMYIRGLDAAAAPGADELLACTLSYFDRTYRHFCSHLQTPSGGKSAGAAVVQKGGLIYFAHPVFRIYDAYAPLWVKTMIRNAIDSLLGDKLVSHDGPSTVMTALNTQREHDRLVLHLLHYIPEKRSRHIEIVEDVIALHDLSVTVQTGGKVESVTCVPSGQTLAFEQNGRSVSFTLDKLCGHQMIELKQG